MLINYDINQLSGAAERNTNDIIETFNKNGKRIDRKDAQLWGYLRSYYDIVSNSQLFTMALPDNVEKLEKESKEDKNSRVKLKTVYAYKNLNSALHAFSAGSLQFKGESELQEIGFDALKKKIENLSLNEAKYLITLKEFDSENLDNYETQVREINNEIESLKMSNKDGLNDEIKSKISKLYGTNNEKTIEQICNMIGNCGYSYEKNAGSKCWADVELICFINNAIKNIELNNQNEHSDEHTIK